MQRTVIVSPRVPAGRRPGRSLVDVLTVAAVVALLLAGSWRIWGDDPDQPGLPPGQPVGLGGVVGVATPDPGGLTPLVREVTLDQAWAQSVSGTPLDDLEPVAVTDCTTASRVLGLDTSGGIVDATPLPTVPGVPGADIGSAVSLPELTDYLPATEDDRESVRAFYRQLIACRNASDLSGPIDAAPVVQGAFWNLLSARFLATLLDPTDPPGIGQWYNLQFRATAALGIQVFPPEIVDVRQLPDDTRGQRQLLVATRWVGGYPSEQMTVLVMEDGLWRVAAANVMRYPDGPAQPMVGVASLFNGRVSAGAEGVGGALLSGVPLSITVTNTALTNVSVAIGGQPVGRLTYGETLYTSPFVVSAETVRAAGGHFIISVSVSGLGILLTEPYDFTVEYGDPALRAAADALPLGTPPDQATPAASPPLTGTPGAATPIARIERRSMAYTNRLG